MWNFMSANIFCFSSDIPAPSRDNRSNAHNRLELVRWAFHYFVCRLTYTISQAVARIADRTASQQTPVHRCSLNFLIRCTNLWWTDNLCTLCLTAVTIRLPPTPEISTSFSNITDTHITSVTYNHCSTVNLSQQHWKLCLYSFQCKQFH